MAFWQLFYSVGSFIAYWINYACQKHVKKLGEWGKTISSLLPQFTMFKSVELPCLVCLFTLKYKQDTQTIFPYHKTSTTNRN